MERSRRKTFQGLVVSDKMEKTIAVEVETKTKHPLYKKLVITHKKYLAHDEKQEAGIGDRVIITETRPLSKRKNFRLTSIVEKAK